MTNGPERSDKKTIDYFDRYEARVFWIYKIAAWFCFGCFLFMVGMLGGLVWLAVRG